MQKKQEAEPEPSRTQHTLAMTRRMSTDGDEDRSSVEDGVTDSCLIWELPMSFSLELFFRLPINGVMRCRAVCSAWNNLLSEPSFSRNYARNSPFTALLHCSSTRPVGFGEVPRLYLLEISDNGDYIRSLITPKVPYFLLKPSLSYIGACNGFLCIKLCSGCRPDVIYFYNPIMGDTIQIRSRTPMIDPNRTVNYKFGFSPATSKFKILKIVFKSGSDRDMEMCEILTIGVDRWWRRLHNSFSSVPVRSDAVALNGFFNWIPDDRGPDFISTFNLEEERFGQISIPPSLLRVSEPMKLAVFGNRLSLVDFSVPSQISVWTMEKYSVVESWTKSVILTSWFPSDVQTGGLVPVAALQNGSMLFQCSTNSLVSCNVEQKRCSKITLEGVGNFSSYFVHGYTPSFSKHAEHIVEREDCVLLCADVLMGKRRRSTENAQQE